MKSSFMKMPKFNGSIKSAEKVKYMSFVVNEKYQNILNKYSETRDIIIEVTRKHVYLKVIHQNKYVTTGRKFYKIWIKQYSLMKVYNNDKFHVQHMQ